MTKQAAYQHLQRADALLHEADQDDPHVVWAHRLVHQASCHFSSLPEVREMAAIDSPIMLAAVPPRYYGEGGVLEVAPAAPTPPQDGREGEDEPVAHRWRLRDPDETRWTYEHEPNYTLDSKRYECENLYTRPALAAQPPQDGREDDGVSDGDLATAITNLLEHFSGDSSLPNGARILLKAARTHLRARPALAAQPSASAVQGEWLPIESAPSVHRQELWLLVDGKAKLGFWEDGYQSNPERPNCYWSWFDANDLGGCEPTAWAVLTPPSTTSPVAGGAIGEATRYARSLAIALQDQHYPEVTQWKPMDDLLGLLTQIDNMTTGLRRPVASDAVAIVQKRAELYGKWLVEDRSLHPQRALYNRGRLDAANEILADFRVSGSVASNAVAITDEMVDAALNDWYFGDRWQEKLSPFRAASARRDVRAALEAALRVSSKGER